MPTLVFLALNSKQVLIADPPEVGVSKHAASFATSRLVEQTNTGGKHDHALV